MPDNRENGEEKKEDRADAFTREGEAIVYISLDQARVLAMRTAMEAPGAYGRRLREVPMAFDVIGEDDTEDHYVITLSFRPQGEFAGTSGQEQFYIEKEGTVAVRQVLSLPKSAVERRFPVIPVVIGALAVATVSIVGIALAVGGIGGRGDGQGTLVPGETIVVEKEVIKEVQVPGKTIVVEKEVIKEVPVEVVVVKEVIKEIQVPGETVVVVEKVVVKEVPVEVIVEKEVVKLVVVPGEAVVIEAAEDAYVVTDLADPEDTQGLQKQNFGSREFLKTWYAWGILQDERLLSISLVKFDLSELKDLDIESAFLQLFAREANLTELTRLLDVHVIREQWSERDVSFQTRPRWDRVPVATAAIYGAGGWYSWNVTGSVMEAVRRGNISFAAALRSVDPDNEEQVIFASREGLDKGPRLLVTFEP